MRVKVYKVKVVLYGTETMSFKYYVFAEDEEEAKLIVTEDVQKQFKLRFHDKFDIEDIVKVSGDIAEVREKRIITIE